MANFMHSLKRWHRVLILIALLWLMSGTAISNPSNLGIFASLVYGALFIAFVVLCLKYENKEKYEARRRQEAAAEMRIEKDREQEEWSEQNGTFSCNVVGVTFRNEDGSSRQAYLKEAYINNGQGNIELVPYKYEGRPAIHVLYEGMCIGNVPEPEVGTVLSYIPRLGSLLLNVETFRDDDDKLIYRADLMLTYKK